MAPNPSSRPVGQPLARLLAEHRRALARLRPFERMACSRNLPAREPRVLVTFARYLEGPFAAHLAAEEHEVFPALQSAIPQLALTLGTLSEDHEKLRGLAQALRALLALPRDSRWDERLYVLGRDLSDLLRLHLRNEGEVLYRWREYLPEDAPRRTTRAISQPRRSRS